MRKNSANLFLATICFVGMSCIVNDVFAVSGIGVSNSLAKSSNKDYCRPDKDGIFYCGQHGDIGCTDNTVILTGGNEFSKCDSQGIWYNNWDKATIDDIPECDKIRVNTIESRMVPNQVIDGYQIFAEYISESKKSASKLCKKAAKCGNSILGTKETDKECGRRVRDVNAKRCNFECKYNYDCTVESGKMNLGCADWFYRITECNDGYVPNQNGTKCIQKEPSPQKENATSNPETKIPSAGDDCTSEDMGKVQYATAGKYINSGGKLKCAATACKNGTYLVVNASGASQGWCVAPSYCKNGTHLNIIENIKTDLKCVTDEPSSDSTTASDDGQSEVFGSDSGTTDESGVSDTSTEVGTDGDGNNDVPDSDNGEELESSQSEQTPVPTKPQDGTQCRSSDSHATAGIYKNGKCMPAVCADGYELSDDKCIEIGGDCDELPKNATASHRKYNPTTRKVDCIVDSCAKNYKKSDDNLSCVQDLEAALESAKAKEQSLTARLTSGAAIGAMGIGGMQALSAVAEQNADADAEQDMKAYLATFRCDFGQGRNIQGGEKEIELPGANSLTQIVMEYTKLAEDLKVRKQALGMEPGIESEHVISAADTGLYDNAALGKTGGAYASLSRALMDENSEDASEISAQKDKTAKKLKTGATVAGVGAAVGIAGNIAVEVTDKKEKNKGNK